MSQFAWTEEQPLAEATVARIVADQVLALVPVRVTARDEGCDNVAFEINNEWVFRFPKRAEGERPLTREMAFLPERCHGGNRQEPADRLDGARAIILGEQVDREIKRSEAPRANLFLSLPCVIPQIA